MNPVDVWAAGPNEAWVVGDGIGHWLGNAWVATQIPQEVYYSSFSAVDGGGGGVFFVSGGHVLQAAPDGRGKASGTFSSPPTSLSLGDPCRRP